MPNNNDIVVNCPNCNKKVIWNNEQKNKPFCSARCKLIDLGEWATEKHSIPGDPIDPELNSDFDPYLH